MYLHLLLWRQLIGQLVGIEFDDKSFDPEVIWAQTWRRFKSKCDAASVRKQAQIRRAESRGEEPPEVAKHTCPAKPLARWDADGTLIWDEKIVRKIERLSGVSDSN